MADRQFNWTGFGLRLAMAAVLVFCTFNPSGYSYIHWLKGSLPHFDALLALGGILLLIGWVMFIRAGQRSLGMLGLVLATAFFAALIWLLVDWGIIRASNLTGITWLAETVLALVLAIGMSWSHIRRRMSGQIDVDEVDR